MRRTNSGLASATVTAGTAVYGELYLEANVAATSLPTANTPVIVTGWTPDQTSLVTLDGVNGTIKPLRSGQFLVIATFDFSGTALHTYKFQICKNGTPIAGHSRTIKLAAATVDLAGATSGIDSLAANDVLTLQVSSLNSLDAVTVENANFSITLIK